MLKLPLKLKTFIWKACKNAIPTRQNLYKRKLTNCPSCPICNDATEDVGHLLLHCPWTRPVWFGSLLQWNAATQNTSRLDLWLQDRIQALPNTENKALNISLLLTLCWYIWKGKNGKAFEDVDPLPEQYLKLASSTTYDNWKELSTTNTSVPNSPSRATAIQRPHWLLPPEGFIKCNSDACFDGNLRLCSIGILMRDDHGNVIAGDAKVIPALSSLQAEAIAMKEVHFLALNLGIKNIILRQTSKSSIPATKT